MSSNILCYIVNSLTPDLSRFISPYFSPWSIFLICTKLLPCHLYTMKSHSHFLHSFNFMASLMVHSCMKTYPKNHLPQKFPLKFRAELNDIPLCSINIFITAPTTFMKIFRYVPYFCLIIYSKQRIYDMYLITSACLLPIILFRKKTIFHDSPQS